MAILEIKTYPDPVLKKKTEKIERVGSEVKKLAQDMIETMRQGDGAGLAGPQVGASIKIFVLDVGDGPEVFINPKILEKKGKEFFEEGCLSLPGTFLKVKRAREIKCRFLDKDGRQKEITAKGLLARTIQHEYDHLDGLLIIDRVNFLRRRKVLKEYKKRSVSE